MPSLTALLAFGAACLVLVLVPGPSVLFVIGRALSAGRRDAVLSVVGNSLGLLVQVVAVVLGLGPVVATSAAAYAALKVAGAAYLVWLGVHAVRHRRQATGPLLAGQRGHRSTPRAVRAGFVVGVTNPKALVFTAALLPQFVDRSAGPVWSQMLVLGVVLIVIGLVSDSGFALAAGQARDWFARSPRRVERMGGTGGVLMIGLGAGLLLTGRPD